MNAIVWFVSTRMVIGVEWINNIVGEWMNGIMVDIHIGILHAEVNKNMFPLALKAVHILMMTCGENAISNINSKKFHYEVKNG